MGHGLSHVFVWNKLVVLLQQKGFLKVWFVSEPFLVRTSGKSGRQWISMSSTAPWSF